ncbi:M20 family metallo-hydrolase [Desulfovibrio sp. ZJ369]|uniref:M20 family metallo-hydrolase n=1 Tax=Desulfovibrio sp. ZJ369 TaxID=2709793 RepID=UPI0013EA0679|nr:M20 family metallo-hydrolase [Desulfovibrio sp. ZJ369]
MHHDLDKLLEGLAQQSERVFALQSALTACKALGPDNGGPGESEKTRLIASWLADCGLTDLLRFDAPDPRVPGGLRPNLIARLPGANSRTLWLFGHTDVVPPGDPAAWSSDPWQVRREGDMLYGRGVEDNQQALVSMLVLAQELQRLRLTPGLALGLVFMADEETGNRYGMEYLLEQAAGLFSPEDLFIVPDAGSRRADAIEVAEKCTLWLKVRVSGAQCHASTPHKGRNAFLAGAEMALACHALHEVFPQGNALFSPPCSTFVPSKHEPNVPAVNIVPGSDVFYVDCRLVPGVDPQDVLAQARTRAAEVARRHAVSIAVEEERCQPASATPADSPVVKALESAVQAVYGVRARPMGIGGGTVAALLRQHGLPAAVWSCIENTCHQPNERSSVSATLKDAQVFAHILMSCDHA